MTADRRVAAVEKALSPEEVVFRVLAEAHEHASFLAYGRAIVDLPIEASPLSRILSGTEACVRTTMKGQARAEIEQVVRRAQGDAMFRYILFVRLNLDAFETADKEGLRAAAAFFWMGCLLGGPRESDLDAEEWAEHQREQRECWQSWRSVVADLFLRVIVDEKARETLEERYLGGTEALFPDAAEQWDLFAEQVERLWSIGEKTPGAGEAATELGEPDEDPLAGRVAARVKEIADDARVSTFERLGELPRAVAIMERRFTA